MVIVGVLDFIDGRPNNQKGIATQLPIILMSTEGLSPKIRYKIPFYFSKSWICYLNPVKNNGVELAFPKGYELSNIQ